MYMNSHKYMYVVYWLQLHTHYFIVFYYILYSAVESEPSPALEDMAKPVSSEGVRSKWELVDYGDDSDEGSVIQLLCGSTCSYIYM